MTAISLQAKKRKFQQDKRRQLKAKQEARRRQLDQEMYEMERNFEQLAAQSADEVLQETSSAAGAPPTCKHWLLVKSA